ncbi:hypothetical protein Btru_071631 [Bulinus truncatus]|nr:hypothetical protein Btru_071631 [Bulinus truncatus]
MPPDLSNVQVSVPENSNIVATCTAILGYPNPMQIVWKTFKNGNTFDLPSDLVVTPTNITQTGDDRCTVRTKSLVSFKASRDYQNVVLACFVTNKDFKPTVPEFCNNQITDLCNVTSSINVTYPVTGVKLSKNPNGTLYEGNSVTLRCYADGNPPPTYTWTKVGDENRTLSGVMDGLDSTLTITNISIASDSGSYNCSSSNMVNNSLTSVSDTLLLTINPPTTSTSTTTTTTTTKKPTSITSTTSPGTNPADASTGTGDSDKNAIIIGVVVGVGGALIIAIIVAIVCYRRKSKPKSIVDEPAEKSYNNNTTYNINLTNANMNYKNTQPDLVANEKKMNSSSLNSSFDLKNDGLSYADLTYDNRPRSRKPMAITDTSSVYSSEILLVRQKVLQNLGDCCSTQVISLVCFCAQIHFTFNLLPPSPITPEWNRF